MCLHCSRKTRPFPRRSQDLLSALLPAIPMLDLGLVDLGRFDLVLDSGHHDLEPLRSHICPVRPSVTIRDHVEMRTWPSPRGASQSGRLWGLAAGPARISGECTDADVRTSVATRARAPTVRSWRRGSTGGPGRHQRKHAVPCGTSSGAICKRRSAQVVEQAEGRTKPRTNRARHSGDGGDTAIDNVSTPRPETPRRLQRRHPNSGLR